ncbi:class I adenylate-forming enzyme family protein [Bogoriella caseilytica]|uniref:Acyl-CoA synthetase (AMP-forming)/AMP-acid ligase II n=1 Tax=Bogoriella caseilytica TaxID=56055 RepID=A0A3N2BCW4_9MICO|nr:class I adenylate-forming enzyme family protein [Bogoriella caseilytica]ROR73090.1 acyl-CoA synthetase (AMP-forming)/AMP-acid ligase II [Bogoriella caseilytica]
MSARTTTANIADRVAGDRPEAPALIAAGASGRQWSYAEFEAAVQSRAADLHGRVTRGQAVGVLAENSPEWLVAFYAIQRMGAVAVPISPKLPTEGARELIAVSELSLLLVDGRERTGARIGDVGVPVADLAAPVAPATFETVAVSPEDDAMVLFTSGSTGLPKGVRLSHRSHSWVIDQLAVPTAPGAARVLIAAPMYHMNALSNSQRALYAGATVVVLNRFEPAAFLAAVSAHRITRLSGVAPMFELILQRPELVAAHDLNSVQEIYLGSAPAASGLFPRLRQAFPEARIKHGFGTTESGPVVFGPHPEGLPTPDGSVGVPHPAVEVRLVGPDGAVRHDRGVLEVRSPALMSGYHHRPDLVPPVTEDGFHHTKDVFAVDEDGFYTFQGREDDMFVCGGENVYPRAVEQVLEEHRAVREAVVVPVLDAVKGFKPVAFVTLQPGQQAAEGELKQHVLDHLEPYAHPRRVWILDDMPLTGVNKADRTGLARRAAELLES